MNLSIHNVSQSLKKRNVLADVSFSLNEGLYVMIGSNGSGKTTLLRTLAGIIKPVEGLVTLDHLDIFELGHEYREILGYAPQHLGYYPLHTVKKFLAYIATLKGMDPALAAGKINEMLSTLNLTDYENVKMKKLSEGVKKRVNIAQALLNDPQVLLLDEPTTGLDIKEGIHLRNLLRKLAADRIILYTSHLLTDIQSLPKEVILLDRGRVVQKEDPHVLLDRLHGKVWLLPDSEDRQSFFNRHSIRAFRKKQGPATSRIRVYSDKEVPNATLVTPEWEDIVFYYEK